MVTVSSLFLHIAIWLHPHEINPTHTWDQGTLFLLGPRCCVSPHSVFSFSLLSTAGLLLILLMCWLFCHLAYGSFNLHILPSKIILFIVYFVQSLSIISNPYFLHHLILFHLGNIWWLPQLTPTPIKSIVCVHIFCFGSSSSTRSLKLKSLVLYLTSFSPSFVYHIK